MKFYRGTAVTTEVTFTGTAQHTFEVGVADFGDVVLGWTRRDGSGAVSVHLPASATQAAMDNVLMYCGVDGAVTSVDWTEELACLTSHELGDLDDLDGFTQPGTWYKPDSDTTVQHVPAGMGSGTFVLEVLPAGSAGQAVQRVTRCHKDQPTIMERVFYSGTWGPWRTVAFGGPKVLWEGVAFMRGNQTAVLSEPVSAQPHGIELVFSAYEDDEAKNWDWQVRQVSKQFVAAHPGVGIPFFLTSGTMGKVGNKYLYVHDDKIVGNDVNDDAGTGCGIAYKNNQYVLRAVYGV